MRFNISFENAELDAAPGDGSEVKPEAVLPTNVAATPGVAGDDLSTDTNDAEIEPSIDTLVEIEKSMQLPTTPDPAYEGVVEGTDKDTAAVLDEVPTDTTPANITGVDGDELGSALEALRYAIECECDESARIMDTVDNLYQLGDEIANTDTLPEAAITATAKNAVAGTDTKPDDIISLEAFRADKQLALEGLAEKLTNAVSSIASGLVTSASNTINFMKFQVAFFNRQKTVIMQQMSQLSALRATKKALTVDGNKFMASASGAPYKSLSEYAADLAKTSDFINQLMIRVEKFTRGNFLSRTKGFLSMTPVPGVKYNEVFNDLYKNTNAEFLTPLSQLPGMQKTGSEGTRNDFSSAGLMGGAVLTVSTSTVVAGSNSNDSSLDAKAVTGITGDMSVKFTTASGLPRSAQASLGEVSGADIQKLLESSRSLVQRIDAYNNFVMRWVSFWSGSSMFNKVVAPTVAVNAVITQWLFSVVRIVRLASYMVFNMTASTFNYAKQLLSNNIKIADAFIKAA